MGKLIIDGNEVYEIDEECMKKRKRKRRSGPHRKKAVKDMTEQRMCLDTFLRLRRSLATSTLYAAVSILAEFFYFTGKQFPVK